jgi:hypothetical protein
LGLEKKVLVDHEPVNEPVIENIPTLNQVEQDCG